MMKIFALFASLPLLFSLTGLKAPMNRASSFDGRFYDTTQKMDFTDSTQSEIDAYYGDIEKKTGNDLLSYLYTKISCPTSELSKYYLTYGAGLNGVGKWYQITDRNWSISEDISPDTFKFVTSATATNAGNFFFYNMYISDSANNDKTKAYSNVINSTSTYKVSTGSTAIDYTNHTKPNNNIQADKEHVWAKNHGFKNTSSGSDTFDPGAPTDLHHLVAADHNTNSAGHSDRFYGTVAKHDSTTEIKNYLGDGTSEVSGWLDKSTDTFEPTDEWKGDVARCLLYMGTRYSVKKDVNTIAEPYLYLTDDTTYTDDDSSRSNDEKIYHGVAYNLSTLLDWNESDPVSEYEKHRNNLIYKNVQNNRNPYVDHPEWARRVYDSNYVLEDDEGETSSSQETSSSVPSSTVESSQPQSGTTPVSSAPVSSTTTSSTTPNSSSNESEFALFGLTPEQTKMVIIIAVVIVLVLFAIIIIILIKSGHKKEVMKAGKKVVKAVKKSNKKSKK